MVNDISVTMYGTCGNYTPRRVDAPMGNN